MDTLYLQVQINELQQFVYRLLHLGEDCGFVYASELSFLNREVHTRINTLYNKKARNVMQEAELCLALLMGFSICMYANSSDEQKRQRILERCRKVLDQLPDCLLKCRLLTFCYGEVYEEVLAQKAHKIIEGWGKREYTREEKEVIDTLLTMEKSLHLCSGNV